MADIKHARNQLMKYINKIIWDNSFKLTDSSNLSEAEFEAKFSKSSCADTSFKLIHINIRSLNANIDRLKQLLVLLNCQFHVIVLSEIWSYSVERYSRALSDYNFIYELPFQGSVGGVAMYIHKSILFTRLSDKLSSSALNKNESLFIEISFKQEKLIIGGIYRHPSSCCQEFVTSVEDLFQRLNKSSNSVLLVGDINIDLLKFDKLHNCKLYLDTLMMNKCLPLITHPTRVTEKSATLIDHISLYLDDNSKININNISAGNIITDVSDHFANFFIINKFDNNNNDKFNKQIRIFSSKNIKKFKAYFESADWTTLYSSSNVNEAFEVFYKYFDECYNVCFPLVKASNKNIKDKVWITSALKKSSIHKNKLYKKWVLTKSTDDLHTYKVYNKVFAKVVKNAKIKYYNDVFSKYSHDPRKTWKQINQLISISKSKNPYTPIQKIYNGNNHKILTNSKDIANEFNSYFCTIGKSLASKIPASQLNSTNFLNSPLSNTFVFEPITESDIILEFNAMKAQRKSSYESYNITAISEVITHIAKPLEYIYNLSITTGTFIEKLKTAKVIPIYKKGANDDVGNYRPISLLSIFDKCLEKIMHKKLVNFWNKYEIFYQHQYGFRSLHNTTSALIEITDYLYKSLDEGYYVAGVYLDVQKAFDSVDHEILINKLQHYGIRGFLLQWFKSYLNNRKQFTLVNGINSDLDSIKCGVPQGSALGPLLFLIYINDLPSCSTDSSIRLFADDTNQFVKSKSQNELLVKLKAEIDHVIQWFLANKLNLNVTKSNFSIFSPNPSDNLPQLKDITFHFGVITRATCVKYLGLYVDEQLLWKSHIEHVCNKIKKYCGIFYKARLKIPKNCLKTIYFAIIHSNILYGIEVYANTRPTYIDELLKINNKILRILQFKDRYSNVSDLYSNYSTLNVMNLHKKQLITLAHRFILCKDTLPSSFRTYFTFNFNVHEYNTRFRSDFHVDLHYSSYGLRSISYSAAKLWNNLPHKIKEITNFKLFNSALSVYLSE